VQNLLIAGPVAALIMADSKFMAYSSGVFNLCPTNVTPAQLNHAVVIVGMDSNLNYIIKNSWGTRWGDSGFGIVNSSNDCGLSTYIFQYTWGYQILGSSLFLLLIIFAVLQ
jgi:hypothetical protein